MFAETCLILFRRLLTVARYYVDISPAMLCRNDNMLYRPMSPHCSANIAYSKWCLGTRMPRSSRQSIGARRHVDLSICRADRGASPLSGCQAGLPCRDVNVGRTSANADRCPFGRTGAVFANNQSSVPINYYCLFVVSCRQDAGHHVTIRSWSSQSTEATGPWRRPGFALPCYSLHVVGT